MSLYNLSVIHKKKYFDSEMDLMAYINDNWDLLQLGEVRVLLSNLYMTDYSPLTLIWNTPQAISGHTLFCFMESFSFLLNIKMYYICVAQCLI